MSLSDSPHLVFLPSGTGITTLFLRLAVKMASLDCKVTFINLQPQPVYPKFSNQPRVEVLDFEIEADAASDATITDPFLRRVEIVNRGLYRLNPILSSSHAQAIISDFAIAATIAEISDDLNIPLYLVSTTSAQFLALVANIPFLLSRDSEVFSSSAGEIEVDGMPSIPKSNIPASWIHNYSTNHLLKAYLLPNARALSKARGILLNTFDWFEQEMLSRAANSHLPPLFPIGPLPTYEKDLRLPWLSEQPAQSVVYVDFGSREVMSENKITEMKKGLEISGYRYLWATQGNSSRGFEGLSGEACLEKHEKGVIVRGGIDQERVLADPAVGLFVNQCEWQSIMQAAWEGVPVLAWHQHGDQNMNAEAVEKNGLGVWMKQCGGGGEKVVDANRISQLVAQMMQDLNIKKAAKIVRERAWEACENGGTSQTAFDKVMQMFTSNKN